MSPARTAIFTEKMSFQYGGMTILKEIDLLLPAGKIIGITGPSGTGKSTLLSIFNRLWEETGAGQLEGVVKLSLAGEMVNIYRDNYPLDLLRRKVGMVFQNPNPLPMSIAKNLAFPLQLMNIRNKKKIKSMSEKMLRRVHLWDEVHDRLQDDARFLSGGQQQRLCIARSLMLEPEILLLDEPTSSLDQQACFHIEKLLKDIKGATTILLVSHYQDQIQRIADLCYTLHDGQLIRQR